jgi:hypothetical protein
MTGELHQISLEIGEMRSDIKNLVSAVRELKEDTTEEHRKVHIIVDATGESMRNVARDVAYMKPLVEDFRDKRADIATAIDEAKDYRNTKAEARGAKKLLIVFYSVFGGFVAWALGRISENLPAWMSARPHP